MVNCYASVVFLAFFDKGESKLSYRTHLNNVGIQAAAPHAAPPSPCTPRCTRLTMPRSLTIVCCIPHCMPYPPPRVMLHPLHQLLHAATPGTLVRRRVPPGGHAALHALHLLPGRLGAAAALQG